MAGHDIDEVLMPTNFTQHPTLLHLLQHLEDSRKLGEVKICPTMIYTSFSHFMCLTFQTFDGVGFANWFYYANYTTDLKNKDHGTFLLGTKQRSPDVGHAIGSN